MLIEKDTVRKEMIKRRSILTKEQTIQAGERIYSLLCRNQVITHKVKGIYSFASFRNEPNTEVIFHAIQRDFPHIKISYPIVEPKTRQMSFVEVKHITELREGYQGIAEPSFGTPVHWDDQASLMFLPGLGFDIHGARVGYGGGFYDRFLEKRYEIHKIALCLDFQVLRMDTINASVQDVFVDAIATPDEYIQCRRGK